MCARRGGAAPCGKKVPAGRALPDVASSQSIAASASLPMDNRDCLDFLRIFREALGPTVFLDSPPLHVTGWT